MKATKGLYGNCVVKHGEITMFRCGVDRMNWYLEKGLAVLESSDPPVLQINFTPKGPGHSGDPYFLQEFKNRCVVCGKDEDLSHHHIVPYCYRRHFPKDSYEAGRWFYDVLLLCVRCHDRYERQANGLKDEIASEHGISSSGLSNLSKDDVIVIKACAALVKHSDEMPEDRRKYFEGVVKAYLGVEQFTREEAQNVWKNLMDAQEVVAAGVIVVSKLTDFDAFAIRWRQHFMKHMKPKFLPIGWNPERRIYSEPK